MKTNRLICTAILVLTISSLSMSAQPPRGHYPEGRHHMVSFTPRQRAEQRTNEMDKAVRLDDKQYKKIYKIFLKEENAKESSMILRCDFRDDGDRNNKIGYIHAFIERMVDQCRIPFKENTVESADEEDCRFRFDPFDLVSQGRC